MHYNRWVTKGSPTPEMERIIGDDTTRFWSKVEKGENCWLWRGEVIGRTRYGTFRVRRHHVMAHRWSYEQEIGPIPMGYQIDHLCRTALCVRPDHLEAVTQAENLKRQAIAAGGWERRCDVGGCGREHRCYGMCNMHFCRWKKAGRPELVAFRVSQSEQR